jgi:plastocyanin
MNARHRLALSTTFIGGLALVAMLALTVGCGPRKATDAAPVLTNQVNLPPSYKFEPAVIQVTAGTTVTWTNNDHFTHSVEMKGMDDHVMKPGDSVTITFDQPGSFDYECTLHPHDMQGKVIVVAP